MATDPNWREPHLCSDCSEPFHECICGKAYAAKTWHPCPVCKKPDGSPRWRTDTAAGLAHHMKYEHHAARAALEARL